MWIHNHNWKRKKCASLRQQERNFQSKITVAMCVYVMNRVQPTWEAPQHGVSVVTPIKHFKRVPVLLSHKANHLDLKQWKEQRHQWIISNALDQSQYTLKIVDSLEVTKICQSFSCCYVTSFNCQFKSIKTFKQRPFINLRVSLSYALHV